MKDRHLFMFGGSPPFGEKLGKKFAQFSAAMKKRVAILFIERKGWKAYMPTYTKHLEANGITDFLYFPLTSVPSKIMIDQLRDCSGIIIGGGETERYRDFIVDTDLGEHIRQMYEAGIPIAGFSAGALIIPERCIIPPIDNERSQHLFLRGIGLIKDCVISVHFSKWDEEENLNIAFAKTNAANGFGIDDGTGIYLVNEKIAEIEGNPIYTVNKESSSMYY